ncbi:hypothetical protein PVAP13_5NG443141 [Panicum virgatum]|uniref:Uncharacterized protein n=1 Tax=Panicum virgatum TaxID=38727 RepID=A0A8T0S057_PANVG|nr:hypothetical protein PVAP13_5NG443141 [Panicum virgatum]
MTPSPRVRAVLPRAVPSACLPRHHTPRAASARPCAVPRSRRAISPAAPPLRGPAPHQLGCRAALRHTSSAAARPCAAPEGRARRAPNPHARPISARSPVCSPDRRRAAAPSRLHRRGPPLRLSTPRRCVRQIRPDALAAGLRRSAEEGGEGWPAPGRRPGRAQRGREGTNKKRYY